MARTAGSRALRTLVAAALLSGVTAAAFAACDSSDDGDSGQSHADGFDRGALVSQLATNVIQPAHLDFVTHAERLEVYAGNYASSVGSGLADSELQNAQLAWLNAMTSWQRLELMQLGPAATPDAPGAQSLRDAIYSWPTTSACAVDQQVVSQGYADADFIEKRLVNVYGLDALEYLLFHHGPDNQCASASSINRDGTWAAISAADLAQRRADYAVVVATGVAAAARQLADAWAADKGDFLGELTGAATGDSTVYDSVDAAVDALFAAMFYLDLAAKDAKLGETIGRSTACETTTCGPDRRESRWANHSREQLVANLEGFRQLLVGGDDDASVGFDDFLAARDGASVATELTAAVDAALTLLRAETRTLATLLADDVAQVEAFHDAFKAINDVLKGDVVVLLQVEVPKIGKGDAD